MNTETAKHTPGPWTAWDDDGTGTLPCVLSKQITTAGNFYVAQCNVFEDARLIAAAPMLLNHLRNLILAIEENIVLTTNHAAYICAKEELDKARGVK